jgi:hypothetical protein
VTGVQFEADSALAGLLRATTVVPFARACREAAGRGSGGGAVAGAPASIVDGSGAAAAARAKACAPAVTARGVETPTPYANTRHLSVQEDAITRHNAS